MIDELIGDESMYETLMEIMEPKLKARDEKIRINEAVSTLRDIGYGDDKISPAIIKKELLASRPGQLIWLHPPPLHRPGFPVRFIKTGIGKRLFYDQGKR